jgi:hypothetical protein
MGSNENPGNHIDREILSENNPEFGEISSMVLKSGIVKIKQIERVFEFICCTSNHRF